MDKLVKDIYTIASKINSNDNVDQILQLKIEFDKSLDDFYYKTSDYILLYDYQYTNSIQQQIIDDAIDKIVKAMILTKQIDEDKLGDFFSGKE